jgi:hypothetical protein
MPFDETPNEGGGGGGPSPCDPDRIEPVINAMTIQLIMNIEKLQLCPLCTHLEAAEHVMQTIVDNMKLVSDRGDLEGAARGRQRLAEAMQRVSKMLRAHNAEDRKTVEGRDDANG